MCKSNGALVPSRIKVSPEEGPKVLREIMDNDNSPQAPAAGEDSGSFLGRVRRLGFSRGNIASLIAWVETKGGKNN